MRAVHDDIHEDFLERELKVQRLRRWQLRGRPELLQEPGQDRQLCCLARDDRAALVHGPLDGAAASAVARSGCTVMMRLNPLRSNTSRTAGLSAQSEKATPVRCAPRAAS